VKKNYVEKRDGGYWVAGTRVSLDSIVYEFNRGSAPETIQKAFSVLTLEEVYGSLTYYLANQAKIDAYLAVSEKQFEVEAEAHHKELMKSNPEFAKRLSGIEVSVR
jgi:uncharacterized protein (DUF433 family)